MTNAHKVTLGFAVALALFAGWALYGFVKEHEARAVLATQQKDAEATQAAIAAKEKDNQAQLAATLAQYGKLRVTVQTPQQVAAALPSVMPTLPAPIEQVSAAQAQATASLPDAPKLSAGDLIIPASSTKSFFNDEVSCKENEAQLSSCQETVSNQTAEMKSKDTLISEQSTALKGGSKWHRFFTDAKWAAIGIGIGIAVDKTKLNK